MLDIAAFLRVVERFCAAAEIAEATLSTRLFSDGKRLAGIRGGSDVGVIRLALAMQWLSDNWPEKAVWPTEVKRPEPSVGVSSDHPEDLLSIPIGGEGVAMAGAIPALSIKSAEVDP